MKLKFVAAQLCVFAAFHLSAQDADAPMQQFFKNELNRISKKVYLAAINGKITAFYSDSLATKMSLEDAKNRGSEMVFNDSSDANNPEIMRIIPFSPDSVNGDLTVVYKITRGPNAEIIYNPFAVAPVFAKKINGMQIRIPLFYTEWKAFLSVLTKDEAEFYMHFITLKQFEYAGFFVTENQTCLNCDVELSNWIYTGTRAYYNQGMSEIAGKWIFAMTEDELFQKYYRNPVLKLYDFHDKPVSIANFSEKHKTRVYTQIMRDTSFADTWFLQLPQAFSNVKLMQRNKEVVWVVSCRAVLEKGSSWDKDRIGELDYYFKDEDVKNNIHPELYFFMQYYFRHQNP